MPVPRIYCPSDGPARGAAGRRGNAGASAEARAHRRERGGATGGCTPLFPPLRATLRSESSSAHSLRSRAPRRRLGRAKRAQMRARPTGEAEAEEEAAEVAGGAKRGLTTVGGRIAPWAGSATRRWRQRNLKSVWQAAESGMPGLDSASGLGKVKQKNERALKLRRGHCYGGFRERARLSVRSSAARCCERTRSWRSACRQTRHQKCMLGDTGHRFEGSAERVVYTQCVCALILGELARHRQRDLTILHLMSYGAEQIRQI